MGTVSTKSKDQTYKISESMDESAECDFKINYLKKNSSNIQSHYQSETTENTKKTELNDLIPYKFEWIDGGTNVKILGNFLDNWNREESMIYNNEKNIYELILNVPKGINQFKFIINNNEWVCSKHYKIVKDNNNNENNEIYIGLNSDNYTNNTNSTLSCSYNQEIKKKKKKFGKGNNDYDRTIPIKSVFNSDAPNIPWYYKSYINLDYNINKLDDDKLQEKINDKLKEKSNVVLNVQNQILDINKDKILLENKTFKSILTIPHEKLSHLFYNLDNENKYIRSSMTQRSKHKFLTVVYFFPKK